MIYGYVFDLPSADDKKSQSATLHLTAPTMWDQSVDVYHRIGREGPFEYVGSVDTKERGSDLTIPGDAKGQSVLLRLMHKKGAAADSWDASNAVLLYHGPQDFHEAGSTAHRSTLAKIVAEDGNDDDYADMMAYFSYDGSSAAASISAILKPMPEGFKEPPAEAVLPAK